MNIRIVVALVVALSMAAPATVFAEGKAPVKRKIKKKKGIYPELFVGAGMNMCMADGDSKCKDTDTAGKEQDIGPSWNTFLAIGARINWHLGVYLDTSYGALAPSQPDSGQVTMNLLTIMPTVRGFYRPSKKMELYGGLGVGYTKSSYEASGGGATVTGGRTNMTDMKLNAGGIFYIQKKVALGLNLDYIFLRNEAGEQCMDIDGTETCSDIKAEGDYDGSVPDAFQASFIGRFAF